MLEFDLWRLSESDSDQVDRLKSILVEGKAVAAQSNREQVEFLIGSIGLCTTRTRDDGYYAEAASYVFALLHAHLDEPDAAVELIRRSNVLPFDGGNLIFSEAVTRSLQLAAQQEDALARHVPSLFLSTMPRAASATLASTIARLFDCPIMRASIGRFPAYYLVPFWVNRLSRGGCVLHDHFGPNEFNRRTLSQCGIRTVFVMIRDPRAAAASYVQHSKGSDRAQGATEEEVMRAFDAAYVPWLRSWEEYEISEGSAEVVWLKSSDVSGGSLRFRSLIQTIAETLKKSAPDWQSPDLTSLELVNANFVTGSADGWRNFVSKSGQEYMWSKVPSRFREMLELKP